MAWIFLYEILADANTYTCCIRADSNDEEYLMHFFTFYHKCKQGWMDFDFFTGYWIRLVKTNRPDFYLILYTYTYIALVPQQKMCTKTCSTSGWISGTYRVYESSLQNECQINGQPHSLSIYITRRMLRKKDAFRCQKLKTNQHKLNQQLPANHKLLFPCNVKYSSSEQQQ